MRRDMAKLLVERARFGGEPGRPGRRPRGDPEDLPKSESMRRRYILARSDKSLNEYFGPLRGYLLRQVGRPWNKVYSEICQHANRGNAVQHHLREHIADFVSVGVPIGPERRAGVMLYVHPRTGILRRTPRNRPRRS
jgi:hypothetical protein